MAPKLELRATYLRLPVEHRDVSRRVRDHCPRDAAKRCLQRFMKRITLIVRDGMIEKIFYPVFPPERNAEEMKKLASEHS